MISEFHSGDGDYSYLLFHLILIKQLFNGFYETAERIEPMLVKYIVSGKGERVPFCGCFQALGS